MEKINYKDNPAYKEVFHSKVHDTRIYMPTNTADGYPLARIIAAEGAVIYASAGATKEVLGAIMDKMIEICNEGSAKTVKTDVAILANNIKYRLSYPVDEDASIRIGALLCFMENEDPALVVQSLTDQKLQLAKGDFVKQIAPDPDMYAFFLSLGIEFLGRSIELDNTTIDTEYFRKRQETLRSLTPQPLPIG